MNLRPRNSICFPSLVRKLGYLNLELPIFRLYMGGQLAKTVRMKRRRGESETSPIRSTECELRNKKTERKA